MEIHMFGIRKSEYIFSCSFLFSFFEHLLLVFFLYACIQPCLCHRGNLSFLLSRGGPVS